MIFSLIRALSFPALALSIAACAQSGVGQDDRLDVVATTTQVGSVVEQIGGDAVDLEVLLEPGVEAHDFELDPTDAAALERADLVLMSGAGLEDWLTDALEAGGGAERVRDLSDGVELRAPAAEEPAHGDEDEHTDEHGDDAVDPHYWLDAANAIVMVENVRDALAEAAPESAALFEERADALTVELEAADAEIRRLMEEIPAEDRRIVTDHDALGYFIDAYGLEFVGSIFPSLDVSSEPSAREIETLVSQIRGEGVRAIFTESSVNPRLARAIAEEAGARLVDDPLYTDSLGPPGSDADTLGGMLLHNARVIHEGLTSGE